MENISGKVKHGIKWQFITNIIGQGVYLLNGIILARILDPKDFGIYGMSLILSDFVFMFWNLGLNAALIQRKDVEKKHLDTAFSISILMGIMCFFITWFSAPFLASFFKEPIVSQITRIIAVTFILYAMDRVPTALLTKHFYFKEITIVGLAHPVIYGLVAIPLAVSGFGPISFAWGIVLGAFGVMLGKIIFGFKLFSWRPRFAIDKDSAKNLLGFGVFIMLYDIFNYLLGSLPRIIGGKFFGAVDLGYFTHATNTSYLPLQKVQVSVGNVLLPAFSSIQDSTEKIKMWFRKFNFFTYAIISPPILFFVFFPNEFISGIFGKKWLPSAPLLIWMSASAMLGASYVYFQNIMKAVGKPHLPFLISISAFIPFMILLAVGMKHGILGIAIALFILTILIVVANVIVLQFYRILSIKDIILSALEPITISLIASLFTLLVKPLVTRTYFVTEANLVIISFIFATILLPYYFLRYFKRSFITYLGFDIKEVMKLQ